MTEQPIASETIVETSQRDRASNTQSAQSLALWPVRSASELYVTPLQQKGADDVCALRQNGTGPRAWRGFVGEVIP